LFANGQAAQFTWFLFFLLRFVWCVLFWGCGFLKLFGDLWCFFFFFLLFVFCFCFCVLFLWFVCLFFFLGVFCCFFFFGEGDWGGVVGEFWGCWVGVLGGVGFF